MGKWIQGKEKEIVQFRESLRFLKSYIEYNIREQDRDEGLSPEEKLQTGVLNIPVFLI